MPEDKNQNMPEENLEPEENKELEAEEELKPEEAVEETENLPEEMEVEEEGLPEEPSEEVLPEEAEEGEPLQEQMEAGSEETEGSEEEAEEVTEEPVEELPEEEELDLEEEEPHHRKGRMSWWVIVLVLIIVVSIFNTLWNKIENKIDAVNETVVSQTEAIDSFKAEIGKLQELADQQEVRINKAERYIRSIRNNMTDLDQKAENTLAAAKRHEDWLRKDLERKKLELEELSAVIAAQESILNGGEESSVAEETPEAAKEKAD